MIKNKRSQGLSINVIIIAALALIVLVVLAAIFTGRVKIFSEGLQSCVTKQGHCEKSVNANWPTCPNGMAVIQNTECEKDKKVCCLQVTN